MGDANHPSRAIPVPGGKGGTKSRNPYGRAAPDQKARRSIGEVFRSLASSEELGKALLAIAAGVDPWAKERKRNPDNVPAPALGGGEIDWSHRTAALKLFLEYHSGKPVQGVVVQAEIDQRIAIEGQITTGPLDLRAMSPEQRQAFRIAALAALGKLPAGGARGVIDAISVPTSAAAPESVGERDRLGSAPTGDVQLGLGLERALSDGDVLVESDGGGERGGGDESAHGNTVRPADPDVKSEVEAELAALEAEEHGGVYLEFRGSSNLVDARLVDGVCTVRFRATDGTVARTYRYANVTPEMMDQWRAAPSAGAWFARQIKARHQQFPVIPSSAPRPVPVVL